MHLFLWWHICRHPTISNFPAAVPIFSLLCSMSHRTAFGAGISGGSGVSCLGSLTGLGYTASSRDLVDHFSSETAGLRDLLSR